MLLYFLVAIIGIFITIFFVVGTHEYAHFITARLLGIKVLRFSIGFGKTLLRFRDKKNTEYVFSILPLGGYVKMLDENEGPVAPEELHLAFNRQPYYKKFLVVLAGPLMNIFCALILYWIIFSIGFVTIKPLIGEVAPHSIAAEAGLKPKQEITHLDNKPIASWTNVLLRLLLHLGNQDQASITVKNPNNTQAETYLLDLSTWQINELNPDPLQSLGLTPYQPEIPLVIGIITKNSPATSAKLQINDKIVALNNKPVKNWEELITTIIKKPGEQIILSVERNHQRLNIPMTVGIKHNMLLEKSGYLGISPNFIPPKELLLKVQFPPGQAFVQAWQEIVDFTYFNFLLFGKLITGKLSLKSMGGPITIFESAGDALNSGFLAFISFLAFLSISIGVINLLPIPGLDGGHLVIQTVEFIIRKPLPERLLSSLYTFGFLLIIFVLIQALVNDVLRL